MAERKRAYMRAYKAKQYEENPERINLANRCYYAKQKYMLSDEEFKLFGDLTPECAKTMHLLNTIEIQNPTLVRYILARFEP